MLYAFSFIHTTPYENGGRNRDKRAGLLKKKVKIVVNGVKTSDEGWISGSNQIKINVGGLPNPFAPKVM